MVCQSLVRDSLITRFNFVDPDRRVLTRLECMKKNTSKSKALFLASKNTANKIMEAPPILTIRGEQIQISETEKLLGVHVNNTLTWSVHIEATLKKCNSLLYLLNRIKQYINVPTRKLFYNAYILPHLDYCCSIWGNAIKY